MSLKSWVVGRRSIRLAFGWRKFSKQRKKLLLSSVSGCVLVMRCLLVPHWAILLAMPPSLPSKVPQLSHSSRAWSQCLTYFNWTAESFLDFQMELTNFKTGLKEPTPRHLMRGLECQCKGEREERLDLLKALFERQYPREFRCFNSILGRFELDPAVPTKDVKGGWRSATESLGLAFVALVFLSLSLTFYGQY